MELSKRAMKMKPSGIREFFDLVIGMKDVVSLGIGEPDFVTPWNICESSMFAIEKGYTSYTSNKGLYDLRVEISKYLKKKFGMNYDPDDEILITTGSSEAFDLSIRAIVNTGDRILVQNPSYVSYDSITSLEGGRPVLMPTGADVDFKLTPEIVEKNFKKGVKAVILNYPTNPTGVSYTKKELIKLAEIFKKHNLIVICDEIYEELTYDFTHTPISTLPGMKEKTIYINGFSKAFAMTGWRVGYACGPKQVIDLMTKIHQYTMLCAPIMGQIAGIEALKNGERQVMEMKKEYKLRREFIVDKLNDIGLACRKPEGAFYVFPSIKNTGMKSMEFSKELLKKEKVAVVPGTAFGTEGEGYIRISYASSMDNLKEAVYRIGRFVEKRLAR